MRKIVKLLITLLLLFGFATSISADSKHIVDEKDYLSNDEISALENKANDISKETGYDLMFIITDRELSDSYVSNLYSSYGYTDGVSCIVSFASSEFNIRFYGSAELILNDEIKRSISNSFIDYMNDDCWSTAINTYLDNYRLALLGQYEYENVDVSSNGEYVVDNAGLLDEEQEKVLNEMISEIRTKYNYDVVIVTTNSTGDLSAKKYADDFYDYNGYGYGDTHDGMLFLVTLRDNEGYRTYWTSTCGIGIKIFNDNTIDQIGDSIVSYLSAANYFYAFKLYLQRVDYYLDAYDPEAVLHRMTTTIMFGGLGLGLIVASIFIGIKLSQLKTRRKQFSANSYARNFNLSYSRDILMYSSTDRRYSPQESSSSGGGSSGGSSHFSSSGSSHGGGGGHF